MSEEKALRRIATQLKEFDRQLGLMRENWPRTTAQYHIAGIRDGIMKLSLDCTERADNIKISDTPVGKEQTGNS